MNYPTKEQRDAFIADLAALVEKHGVGIEIGGWECEIHFVPAKKSNLVFEAQGVVSYTPSPSDGWDDVLDYGPKVPREIRAQTPMGQLGLMYEDAVQEELNNSELFLNRPPHQPQQVVTLNFVRKSGTKDKGTRSE